MNKLLRWVGLLILPLCGWACSNTQKSDDNKQVAAKELLSVDSVQKPVLIENEALQAIFDQYIVLSKSLVNSDYVAAKEQVLLLEMVSKQNLVSKNMAKAMHFLSVAKDLSSLRTAFSDFSNTLIAEVKAAGMQSGSVYLAHCPMAEMDKGASWLSTKNEVLNPYYGDEMLDCGEVQEEIK
jgi:hypothetical protein